MEEKKYRVQAADLRAFVAQVFIKAGLSEADAKVEAESLVEANLRGTDSHGVLRIENYIGRLKTDGASASAKAVTITETPATILMDAQNGLGAAMSMQICGKVREKAEKQNLAFGVLRGSNHFGAGAYWAHQLAQNDMIGFCGSNVEPLMAAIGGKAKAIGNNPFALVVPAGKYAPVCLDMATSVVALGKALEYRTINKSMPEGWFCDEEGNDTTDPFKAVLAMPFGGHKGFGIAVAVELLSSLLAGGEFGAKVNSMYGDAEKPNKLSHCFFALRIEAFRDLKSFSADMEAFIGELKGTPKKAGVAEIFYPGEPEAKRREQNLAGGIVLPSSVVGQLCAIAKELGVDGALVEAITKNPAA